MPEPDLGEAFDRVYAEMPPELRAQQQWFRDYHASFQDAAPEGAAHSAEVASQ
jgi:2-oxoisovalerate dehydrogenase E1 component alpha subunit